MSNQSVSDAGEPKRYWTQIPNIVFDLDLKPLALLLYAHLKRAAGANLDGKCTKSTATLVRETGMGAGTISRVRAELAKCRPDLKNKPLITITEIPNPKGGKAFQHITITDIWKINMERFATSTEEIGAIDQVPAEVGSSSKPISRVEIKKNPEEKPDQEKPNPRGRAGGRRNPKPPFCADPNAESRAELITFLQDRHGPMRSTREQAKALNWVLGIGYTPEQCRRCFEYLESQTWRGQAVTWLTVEKEIGTWRGKGEPEKDLGINGNGATSARPVWMAPQK